VPISVNEKYIPTPAFLINQGFCRTAKLTRAHDILSLEEARYIASTCTRLHNKNSELLMHRNASPYLVHAVIDNGVALVTSAVNGRCNVMTASFFAEISHISVLSRVAIAPSCLTHDLIVRSGWFGLSLLSKGQEEPALSCGSISGRKSRQTKLRALDGESIRT
jgi:hypothetical protein